MLALVPLEVVVEPALQAQRRSVTVETSRPGRWMCMTLAPSIYLFDARGAKPRSARILRRFISSFLCIVEIRYHGISHPVGQQLHLHVKQCATQIKQKAQPIEGEKKKNHYRPKH